MRALAALLLFVSAGALAQQAVDVTVIRPTPFVGGESPYYVAIDDRVLFDLEAREHVRFTVPAGRHALGVRCPKALYLTYSETRIQPEFKAGDPAFYVIAPKFDCVTIDRVDAREAARLVANTHARPSGRPSGYREGKVEGQSAVETRGGAPNEQIVAATAAWVEAFNSRDASRVAALYEPDAVLTDTGEPKPRVGSGAITEYYRGMAQRPTQRIALGERSVRVFGDTAIDAGNLTYFEMRNGNATTTPGRYSITYRLRGGRWLIVDHHTSLVSR